MAGTFHEIIASAKNGGVKARLAVPSLKKQDLDLLCWAAKEGFIMPLLIGDGNMIEAIMKESPMMVLEHEIVDVKNDPAEALHVAITLAREGQADILMQGADRQRTFMGAVLNAKNGLLKGKLASYVSILQLQKQDKLILITDPFVNNFPKVAEKQIILENALELAGILGTEAPKVAVLAAIEQVNPSIQSTIDAAALSKMSERGQFGKAIVEGPLDMDCALSQIAAGRKGIRSVVTGNADIYLVPEQETGYALVQALRFFGRMNTAGVLMGTTIPIIPDLPFISNEDRMAELALAVLISRKGTNHE